jgi:hypothetical protein
VAGLPRNGFSTCESRRAICRDGGGTDVFHQEGEPTLTRNGYDVPALIVLLHVKPTEVRDFLAGTLAGDRTREFTEQLRAAGVPV